MVWTMSIYVASLLCCGQIPEFNPQTIINSLGNCGSKNDSLPFRENGDTAKFTKWQFLKRFLFIKRSDKEG